MPELLAKRLAEGQHRLRMFETVLDSLHDFVYLFDLDGRFVYVNRALLDLWGRTLGDVVGKTFADLDYPDELVALHAEQVATVIRTRAPLRAENAYTSPTGATRHYEYIFTPVFNEEGELEAVSGVTRDVTERHRIENALTAARDDAERADRAKSVFLAAMSHEIRTPLSAIIGFASLLIREVEGRHRSFAELIERGGRRLMDTLTAVLTLAKFESGRIHPHLRPLPVAREVRDVVELFEVDADTRDVSLHVQTSEASENAYALLDRGAFASILQNLVGNALKFTRAGHVRVRVGVRDARVTVEVCDTGRGMDAAFMARMFDAFSQDAEADEHPSEGAGLGLALTKRLVDLLGGHIEAESTPGVGTRFRVTFATVPPPDEPDAPPPLRADELGACRLLVVEDNADTRVFLRSLLEDTCRIALVGSAGEALQRVRRHARAGTTPVDLVLTDVHLGAGDSGLDLLHELRRLPTMEGVPIVAMTAYALPGDRQRLLDAGFDDYLAKPFTADELIGRLARHVPRS